MAVKIRRTYKGAAVSAVLDSSGVSSATQTAITLSTSPSTWPTGKFFVVVAPGTAQEEKMCVTLSGSTLTVVDPAVTSTSASANGRGVDNTTARSTIAGGSTVYPVYTAIDADEANELTSTYSAQGHLVYQGASTFAGLAIGTAGQVLKVNSGATAPEWGQVPTAGIADDAVTMAKLAAAVEAFLVPVGTIVAYPGANAPTGWLICDGTAINGAYTSLIALVGANTPDLRGHVLVGKGSAPFDGALLSKFGSTTSTAPHTHSDGSLAAASGGSHTHTYSGTTNAQSADHSHGQLVVAKAVTTGATEIVVTGTGGGVDANYSTGGQSANHAHDYSGTTASGGSHTHDVTGDTGASSAAATHGNVQPSALVNYIIKHD